MQQEQLPIPQEPQTPAVQAPQTPAAPEKRGGVRGLFDSALHSLKGRDVNQMVEEFTSEVTLVLEGMSEDQSRLDAENSRLQAQQTLLEEAELTRHHDLKCAVSEQGEQITKLQKQLDALQKAVEEKKIKKVAGFTGLLRQATWLAGILAGTWLVVTIINFFK